MRINSGLPRRQLTQSEELLTKFAALKASPSVVALVCRNVPVNLRKRPRDYHTTTEPWPKEDYFFGCGIVVECQTQEDINAYLCTVVAPASLFHHRNWAHLDEKDLNFDIDVFASKGVLHKAKLVACDFHYNLAAITFKSVSPLPTVTFKGIDDRLPIDPTHHLRDDDNNNNPFQLRPHSHLHKLSPGDLLVSVNRPHGPPFEFEPGYGTFSPTCPEGFSCNELYEIKEGKNLGLHGSPVLNSFGETIGIVFRSEYTSFLPSNTVSRWWNHYKSSTRFCRPFLGMEVANLHEADINFLAQFIARFPNISMGVVVTKVENDSPAHRSGIRIDDVIVGLDSKPVRSKTEFFEKTWVKAGMSVELTILRVENGEELNLCLVIEEASPDKFHQWPHPLWTRRS